jgi:hypothetical protein
MFLIIVTVLFSMCFLLTFIYKDDEGVFGGIGITGLIVIMIVFGGSRLFNSRDLGVIREQSGVIKVYEEKVDRLKEDLKIIIGPNKNKEIPYSLLNADSPIKTITEQLAKSENDLAAAKDKLAQAKVSIASRKAGPFWPTIWIYGDK